jgi:hypothetical protein
MKHVFAGLCALTLLSLISPLTPVQAQTRAVETRHAEPRFQSVAHFGAQPFSISDPGGLSSSALGS